MKSLFYGLYENKAFEMTEGYIKITNPQDTVNNLGQSRIGSFVDNAIYEDGFPGFGTVNFMVVNTKLLKEIIYTWNV